MDAYQMEEIKQQLRGFGPGKPWKGILTCAECAAETSLKIAEGTCSSWPLLKIVSNKRSNKLSSCNALTISSW